jgi:hypothetical protein
MEGLDSTFFCISNNKGMIVNILIKIFNYSLINTLGIKIHLLNLDGQLLISSDTLPLISFLGASS